MRLPFLPEMHDNIHAFNESSCLGLQLKVGRKFDLKLNIGGRPIANKYREGKMKSTLKRELKVPEIEPMEPLGSSVGCGALMLVKFRWRRAL